MLNTITIKNFRCFTALELSQLGRINLIAGKKAVPELMQNAMTGERIAAETARLLDDAEERAKMKEELARVAGLLSGTGDAIVRAADAVERALEVAH